MSIEDNVRQGMPPDQARRAALIRMGGIMSLQQRHREVRGLPGVEAIVQDLRFALRLIATGRGFSAAAIAALALGIGANTVGFTIVNGAFLRGLAFDGADRLYMLCWQNISGRRTNVSYPEFEDWRAGARSFAGLAAYNKIPMNLSDDRATPHPASGARLTSNAFGVLRQPPLFGRDFAADDERPGAPPVVIIGHGLWKSRYGSDPAVLGEVLRRPC